MTANSQWDLTRCLSITLRSRGLFFILLFVFGQSYALSQNPTSEECGATAAFMACCTFIPSVEPYKDFVAKLGPVGKGGYSLEQIEKAIASKNLHTLAIETSLDSLRLRANQQQFLAIVRLDLNHFVLITRLEPSGVELVDFPRIEVLPETVFLSRWKDRKAMLISSQAFLPVRSNMWVQWVIFFAIATLALFFGVKLMHKKMWLHLCFLIVGCSIGCEGKRPLIEPNDPAITIEPITIELGSVKPEIAISVNVRIVNNGKISAEIARISKPCSCIDVVLEKTSIAPGSSCDLKVIVTPTRSRNAIELRIVFEDPVYQEIALPILWALPHN